jgi:integrase/recombinase XerD
MQNSDKLLEQFTDRLLLKRYSYCTIKNYKSAILLFLNFIALKEIWDINITDIDNFINYQIDKNNISLSFQRQIAGALILFCNEILNLNIKYKLPLSIKREIKLPCILSINEIKVLLKATTNIKHKTLIAVLYSCGLRLKEVINLRTKDIDIKHSCINIFKADGKRDRKILISEKLGKLLHVYMYNYNINEWLFESTEGTQYSARSIQMIIKNSLMKAGINKAATVNSLRHSYASHLYEAGVDIHLIKEMLGHQSIKTTKIYSQVTHINKSKVYNPFDGI